MSKGIVTREQVGYIKKKYNIRISSFALRDNKIDVNGNVIITNTLLRKLPLKFGKVYGDFICSHNKLETLEGAPYFVGGNFSCANNQLKSLKYAPLEVGGSYSCNENSLKALRGVPMHIKGDFNAFLNELESMECGPELVEKSCFLNMNKLKTLIGSPKYVGNSIHLTGNLLDNLLGLPNHIGDILSIDSTIKSLYTGGKNCKVKRVEIDGSNFHKMNQFLPESIIAHKKYLPGIFRYMQYLDLFTNDDDFNELNFNDIIYDLQTGLR
ncbi:hypothetical protein [Flavobacterium sp. S87F.05.LMB.W.Kidney.N]|uniref:hypothetical protein n=1 Tax=Flavobacterium sp. S87F.05.LMB.W.Kidney.N TaxID=1278758 RepID=UPI001064BBE5|nr:hypothetical protein [Flavobacterium sp. S87F.05.LMB.W.Kidney.N]TDX11322.1 hypothetical protein EDB96_2107 [Flavobacterium sp. S87F.05.LMB.W.Kidney.N]